MRITLLFSQGLFSYKCSRLKKTLIVNVAFQDIKECKALASVGWFQMDEKIDWGFPIENEWREYQRGREPSNGPEWTVGRKKSRSACFLGRWECAHTFECAYMSTGMWVIQVKTAGIARSDQHSRSNPMSHRVAAIPPLLPTC